MNQSKQYFMRVLVFTSFVMYLQGFTMNRPTHLLRQLIKVNDSHQHGHSSLTSVQVYKDNKVFSAPSNMKEHRLDLKEVRKLAKANHYKEIYLNRPSKVISFSRKNRTKNNQYQDSSARITVYWTTGTVVTCMNHPKKGQTQLIRRDIDMKTLQAIFDNPRDQKGLGYKLNANTSPDGSVFDVAGLEEEAKAQLQWLNQEMGLIQKQRNQVETLIHDFEEKRHAEHLKSLEKQRDEKLHRSAIVKRNIKHINPTISTMKPTSLPITARHSTEKKPCKEIVEPRIKHINPTISTVKPTSLPIRARHSTEKKPYKEIVEPRVKHINPTISAVKLPSLPITARHSTEKKPYKEIIVEPRVKHVNPTISTVKPTSLPVTTRRSAEKEPYKEIVEPSVVENPHQSPSITKRQIPPQNENHVYPKQQTAIVKTQRSNDSPKHIQTTSPIVSPPVARTNRGRYVSFFIHHAEKVEKYFNPNVVCFACGGKSSIFLYESGDWAYTSGLAEKLDHLLTMRKDTALSPPTYVALGSQDRYFIRFKDGSTDWVGSDDITTVLNLTNSTRTVKSVAFGEDYDSYFVIFDDGGWKFKNIPYSLEILIQRIEDSINNRKQLELLDCVTLGSEGQYFVKAKKRSDTDYQYWFGGLTTQSIMSDTTLFKDRIQFVDFGEEGTYIMRYS